MGLEALVSREYPPAQLSQPEAKEITDWLRASSKEWTPQNVCAPRYPEYAPLSLLAQPRPLARDLALHTCTTAHSDRAPPPSRSL